MIWIVPAIMAAFANVGRDMYIKKKCSESSHLIVACTRITAFFVLLTMLPFQLTEVKLGITHIREFVLYMAVTVIFTMVATVLKVRVIQKEDISVTQPLMTLTPIFVLPWGYILLKETATPAAFFGILLSVAGAICVITAKNKKMGNGKNKGRKALVFLFINLMIVGLTTNIDKIEIGYSSAYLYTLIWTGCSALVGLYSIFTVGRKSFFQFLFSIKNIIQALFWTIGFYMQQVAVYLSMDISANTAYIKSISYVSVILSVWVGGKLFQESGLKQKLIGTLVIVAGNLMIVFSV